jgi:hypothetical protein
VLQERLLSVRTVYFGDILSSECAQLGATEIFPGGLPIHDLPMDLWGTRHPFRLTTPLQTSTLNESAPEVAPSGNDFFRV